MSSGPPWQRCRARSSGREDRLDHRCLREARQDHHAPTAARPARQNARPRSARFSCTSCQPTSSQPAAWATPPRGVKRIAKEDPVVAVDEAAASEVRGVGRPSTVEAFAGVVETILAQDANLLTVEVLRLARARCSQLPRASALACRHPSTVGSASMGAWHLFWRVDTRHDRREIASMPLLRVVPPPAFFRGSAVLHGEVVDTEASPRCGRPGLPARREGRARRR